MSRWVIFALVLLAPGFVRAAGLRDAIGSDGRLRPGSHRASFGEIQRVLGTTPARRGFMRPVRLALLGMQRAGIPRAYLAGSLAGVRKDTPGDADLLFEVDGDEEFDAPGLIRVARHVMPAGVTIYSSRARAADASQLPHITAAQRAAWSASPPTFRELFQQDPLGPVGIIEIDLRAPIQPLEHRP